ncbi:MAG: nickel-dependent lactate racemase [Candidatus Bathyarchaeia archaeon]|nr:nickel-dependent lactate racemase [Candidatus Bathyarchaeota archaeon]
MKIVLPYGEETIKFEIPKVRNIKYYTVSSKLPDRSILDQGRIVEEALDTPINTPKLDDILKKTSRVSILVTDKTRATPNNLVIPILLSRIKRTGVKMEHIDIVVANGLHEPMNKSELENFLGKDIVSEYNVVNHVADDKDSLEYIGKTRFGTELYVNRVVSRSSFRIAVGLVEPHFFAGYSGGRKLVLPGVAGVRSIYMNHSFKMIAHPLADYGYLDGNPINEDMMNAASIVGLEYTINIVLDKSKRIIYVSSGDYVEAYRRAVDFLSSLICIDVPFQADITITSNGGYPLDRNLYQAVKGMVTASRATREGGVIIIVSECRDGVGHKDFRELSSIHKDPCKILEYIEANEPLRDQWEVQKLAQVLCKNKVILVSKGIREEEALDMNLLYASNLEEAFREALRIIGRSDVKVLSIPEGPYVIPLPSRAS